MLTPTGVREITAADRAVIASCDDSRYLVELVRKLTPHITSSRSRNHLDALLFFFVTLLAFLGLVIFRGPTVLIVLAGGAAVFGYVMNRRASIAERARIARFREWIEAIRVRLDELAKPADD